MNEHEIKYPMMIKQTICNCGECVAKKTCDLTINLLNVPQKQFIEKYCTEKILYFK